MNKSIQVAVSTVLASAALALPLAVGAQTSDAEELRQLHQQLEAQQQQLKVLERKIELSEEAAKAAAPSTAVVKASPKGFSIGSPDGKNVVKLRGTLHFDGRRFIDDITPETADTFTLRRVRPTLEGTVNGIYDFRFTPDFAGGKTIILDAFAVARFKPWAQLTVGKFKVPVGLERWQGANDLRFVERGLPTSLVPNRDLGISFGGDLAGGVVNYSFGYFNGTNDGASSDSNPSPDVESDDKGDWAARVFVQPFANSDTFALRGLGFGVGATYVNSTGSASSTLLTGYRTPGQQTFFNYRTTTAAAGSTPAVSGTFADGERLRLAPQLYYYLGQFGVLGEYTQVSQEVSRTIGTTVRSDKLKHDAWQVQLAWFITGEEESFKGFAPNSVFSLDNHTWGAFELVARYHQLDIDNDAFIGGAASFANPATAASKATAWGVGLNWYLNQNLKWQINYDRTKFDGGAANGADRPDEEAVFTRFAIGF